MNELAPEIREEMERASAAMFGHKYPAPKHWKLAAFVEGLLVWCPAPNSVRRWVKENSLKVNS